MKYPGTTIFIVFFGLSLLDSLGGGHWLRAGFWLLIGLIFLALDLRRRVPAPRS